MPKETKVKIVSEIKEQLENSQSVVFVDYRGLDANQLNKLRRVLSEDGACFFVAKNTLIERALPSNYKEISPLEGPTALVTSPKSNITAIKNLVEFSKEADKPEVKIGIFEKKILSAEKLRELADIPGEKELLTKLAYNLQYPIYTLTFVNKQLLQKLVLTVQFIAEKKES